MRTCTHVIPCGGTAAALPSFLDVVQRSNSVVILQFGSETRCHPQRHLAKAKKLGAETSIQVRYVCTRAFAARWVWRAFAYNAVLTCHCADMQLEQDLTTAQKEEQQGTALQHFCDSALYFVDKVRLEFILQFHANNDPNNRL